MRRHWFAESLPGILSFAAPLALYFYFPSTMWNFDGVACAIALELGDPVYFFHGNHLIYGAAGYAFWNAARLVGIERALPALQLLTTLFSAAGLWGLYLTVKLLTGRAWTSALVVWTLSVFAVLWVWSLEAQVYTLGFAAMAWGTYVLFKPAFPSQGRWLGFFQAAAFLGHVVNALWFFPVAAAILQMDASAAGKKKLFRDYAVFSALGIAIPYAAVLLFVVWPAHLDWDGVRQWLWGSAALTEDKSFDWHGPGWAGPLIWLKTTLRLPWGTFWPYGRAAAEPAVIGATIFSAGLLASVLYFAWRARREPFFRAALVWLAVYGIFFSTWEPGTECYRVFDFVPIALIFAAACRGAKNARIFGGILAGLLVSLFVVNLRTRAAPMADLSRNDDYQEISALCRNSAPDSTYLTAGGKRWLYLLYFHGRTAYKLIPPDRLMVNRVEGSAVYAQEGVLDLNPDLLRDLSARAQAEPGVSGWYRLVPAGAPEKGP